MDSPSSLTYSMNLTYDKPCWVDTRFAPIQSLLISFRQSKNDSKRHRTLHQCCVQRWALRALVGTVTKLSTYSACSTFVLNQSRVKRRQMLHLIPFKIHFPYASLCRHSTTAMTCSHQHIQQVCTIPHVSKPRLGTVTFCATGIQTVKCSIDL